MSISEEKNFINVDLKAFFISKELSYCLYVFSQKNCTTKILKQTKKVQLIYYTFFAC